MQMIIPQEKKEKEKKNTLPPLGSSEGAEIMNAWDKILLMINFKKYR